MSNKSRASIRKGGFPGARPGSHVFPPAGEEADSSAVGSLNCHKCVCCCCWQNERLPPKQFCSYETQHSFGSEKLIFARKPRNSSIWSFYGIFFPQFAICNANCQRSLICLMETWLRVNQPSKALENEGLLH